MRNSEETTKIREMGVAFVKSVKPLILNKLNSTYNTDQSGFNYELHSGRTLEVVGIKHISAKVQSLSALTHSYTIQPTISADGILLTPLFVILQEKDGKFGPKVQQDLFKATNVFVVPSKSGKLNKEHIVTRFKEIFFPNSDKQSILLVDSWTTYKDKKAIDDVTPEESNLKMHTIPAHTTSFVQPLDVYCFRYWKNFTRRFSDRVLLDNLDIHLHQRNNIINCNLLFTINFLLLGSSIVLNMLGTNVDIQI